MITFHFVKVEIQRPYYKVIVKAHGNTLKEYNSTSEAEIAYFAIKDHLPCVCILETGEVSLVFPPLKKYI